MYYGREFWKDASVELNLEHKRAAENPWETEIDVRYLLSLYLNNLTTNLLALLGL
jgi:hypothetical protein